MTDKDQRRLDRHLDGLETKLPGPLARWVSWLRKPSSRLIRIPVGVLFVVGGIFSFLPLLGLWMLPLGVLLLAIDIPSLKRPTGRALVSARRLWAKWRGRDSSGRQ